MGKEVPNEKREKRRGRWGRGRIDGRADREMARQPVLPQVLDFFTGRSGGERRFEKVLKRYAGEEVDLGPRGNVSEGPQATAEGGGFSEGVVKALIDRLQDEDQVRVEEERILSKGAARAGGEAYPDDDVHDFFVEKVYQGRAVVKVDGKWRAVLAPENYEGPRYLVKKGKRFEAVAELYEEDGKFRAWIKDVVGK